MSIFKYLTLSHLQKVLSALEGRFLGIENDIEDIQNEVDNLEIPTDYSKSSLIVTLSYGYNYETGDDDMPVLDKTYSEIQQAFNEGRNVYLRIIDWDYDNEEEVRMLYLFSKDQYNIFYADFNEDADGELHRTFERVCINSDDEVYLRWLDSRSLPVWLNYNFGNSSRTIFDETVTTTLNSSTGLNEVTIDSNLWDYIVESYSNDYTITCQKTGSTTNTFSLSCYSKSFESTYCTIQANSNNTVKITTPDAAEYTITISTRIQDIKMAMEYDYLRPLQSDWEEDDMGDVRYIINRPAIRAGEGENSIVEGGSEEEEASSTSTILITGDAGAKTYSYTTEDTLPNNGNLSIAKYGSSTYRAITSIDTTNHTITFNRSFNASSALDNASVTIYDRYHWANGTYSHSEGFRSMTFGSYSHAEGNGCITGQSSAHAEGSLTKAFGSASHSEGMATLANAQSSHAEGRSTIAASSYQHVQGKFNIEDSNSTYAHIVGNGDYNAPSNAHTLDWSGNAWYAGKVSAGTVASPANPTAANDLATKSYVDSAVSGAGGGSSTLTDLTDTTISSASNGQILTYNSTNSKWVNSDVPKEVMVVTITEEYDSVNDENYYTADKTVSQIYAHVSNGGLVYAQIEDSAALYSLRYSDENECGFQDVYIGDGDASVQLIGMSNYGNSEYITVSSYDNKILKTTISSPSNGQVLTYNSTTYKWENTNLPSDVFVITVTSTTENDVTTYSADKTFAEITAAHTAGKECIVVNSNAVYTLMYIYSNLCRFVSTNYIGIKRLSYKTITINSDDTVEITDTPFFSYEGSNNAYPLKTLIAQVNGNANTTSITGSLDYSTTAYRAYNAGDLFWLDNKTLAKATTSIASGATLTLNTNYVKTTIEDELKARANTSDVLIKTNTTSYTPTGDYNPATKKYVDDSISGFSTTLSGLTDTTISSPSDGQVLKYDNTSSKWINSTISTSTTVSDLTDTTITNPSNGQMLVYNSTTSKWENATLSLGLSGNTIQLKQGNTVISSITLPVYNGGVSS